MIYLYETYRIMNNSNHLNINASNGQLIGTIKKLKQQLRELTDNDDHKRYTGKITKQFFNTQKGIIQNDSNDHFHFHFLDCDFENEYENEYELLSEVTFRYFERIGRK